MQSIYKDRTLGEMRVHLILNNQNFKTYHLRGGFLSVFHLSPKLALSVSVLGCVEVIPETTCEGSLGQLLVRACKSS